MKKLIARLFGGKVNHLLIGEAIERRILLEMMKIKDIEKYLELQEQGGYQLYAKTDDRKFLGYSELASNLLRMFEQLKKPEPEEDNNDNGYEATA